MRLWRTSALAGAFFCAVVTAAAAQPKLRAGSGGTIHALVIGINTYDHYNNLEGAVADAEDLIGALKEAGVTDIVALEDHDATREAVVAHMERLVATARPNDLVVISYAGHGANVPAYPAWSMYEKDGRTEEFVLGGYDTDAGSGEVIANKEMKAWMLRLNDKGVEVLFIADSCFGGGMMRDVDPRAAGLNLRGLLRDVTPKPGQSRFSPIHISPYELRRDVSDLTRVTFLAGGDSDHEVPEVRIPVGPDPKVTVPRGALSFAMANAIRGKASEGADTITRGKIYDYALQIVGQYSEEQQFIDERPTTDLDRVLFVTERQPPATASVQQPPTDALKIEVLNGDPSVLSGISQGETPFVAARSSAEADLIWDLAKREVVTGSGDLLKQEVTEEDIPLIVDRTAAIAAIKKMSETRLQKVQLADGGLTYHEALCSGTQLSQCPKIEVEDANSRYLVVFNIASDGKIQMLAPERNRKLRGEEDRWTYDPTVQEPFGADCVIAITSSKPLSELTDWLWEKDGKPDAGLLPARLQVALRQDETLRIGTVGLHTAP